RLSACLSCAGQPPHRRLSQLRWNEVIEQVIQTVITQVFEISVRMPRATIRTRTNTNALIVLTTRFGVRSKTIATVTGRALKAVTLLGTRKSNSIRRFLTASSDAVQFR